MSKEFGTALFSLALEEGKEDLFSESLEIVRVAFSENSEYVDLLMSPNISIDSRLNALKSAFATIVEDEVLSFLELMCRKSKISGIYEAIDEYSLQYNMWKKHIVANVFSAHPLTKEQQTALTQKLEEIKKSRVQLLCTVDKNLLGGVIVEIDGTVLDGTLKEKLRNIKEVIDT